MAVPGYWPKVPLKTSENSLTRLSMLGLEMLWMPVTSRPKEANQFTPRRLDKVLQQ